MQPTALIGKGLTSDVYAWGEDRVVKIYHERVPREIVEREFRITKAVSSAGLPVPAPFEMLQVDGRNAITFERIRGISLYRKFVSTPWAFFAAARQLAEVHFQLHSFQAPAELPTQQDQIDGWINAAAGFSDAQRKAARDCLRRMPSGHSVCHGDFHPENILLTERGPVIIDWSRGARGHALGDVCRSVMLVETAEIPHDTPLPARLLIGISRRLLRNAYVNRYLQLQGAKLEEVDAWRPAQLAGVYAWRATRLT